MRVVSYLLWLPIILFAIYVFFQFSQREVQPSLIAKHICKIAVAGILYVLLFSFQGWVNISVQINPAGEHTQLFYRYDSAFSEIDSARHLNETGNIKFSLPRDMNVQQLRLDPAECEGTFFLTGLQINILNIPVKEFSAEQIYENIDLANRCNPSLSGQGIQIESLSSDPTIIFSNEVTKTVNRILLSFFVIKMVLLALPGCLSYAILVRTPVLSVLAEVLCEIKPRVETAKFNFAASVMAIIHFLVCLHIQRGYFTFEFRYAEWIIFYEVVFFIILQMFWQAMARILYNVKQKNQKTVAFLKFTGLYFFVMVFMLVLVWPGYYVTDEYAMLYRSTLWEFYSSYHFLMQGYLVLAQMLIPGAAGAEIVQILTISAIVGYILQQINQRFIPSKWIYLLYIPMLFPSVLLNNLQWQKSIPGTYLEALLLCKIFFAFWDKRKLKVQDIVEWTLLTAVTSTLRMDGFYYPVLAPVVVFFIFYKREKKRVLLCFAVTTILCSMALQQVNNSGRYVKQQYTLINYTRLGYAAIMAADPIKDAAELKAINNLFDLEQYRAAPNQQFATATVQFAPLITSIDNESLASYQSAVMKLILKHPIAHIKQQMECFLASSGFAAYMEKRYTGKNMNDNYQDPDTSHWSEEIHKSQHVEDVDANPLNKPIDPDLRLKTILFCMGRNMNDSRIFSIRDVLFNNLIPSILFLVCLWVYFLIKRQYVLLNLATLFLLRLPILAASASYVSFQYYFRFFVLGNLVPFFVCGYFLSHKKAALKKE